MKTLSMNRKSVVSIVTVMLLIYGIQNTSYGQQQNAAPEFTPVSDRTPQVREAIVALVPGVDSANDVTEAHLSLITNLNLSDQNITALKVGDFDGSTKAVPVRRIGMAETNSVNLSQAVCISIRS